MATRLFTSESVTEGHPDKVCDCISDAVLDAIFSADANARVACECAASTNLVLVMGEVTTSAHVDVTQIVRSVVDEIGYNKPEYGFDANALNVITALNKQSPDIALGVDHALEQKNGEQEFHVPDDLKGEVRENVQFRQTSTCFDCFSATKRINACPNPSPFSGFAAISDSTITQDCTTL